MELLAIPLGCQNTAAKWLVMRRCAVLEILMYLLYIPVSALTSDLAGVLLPAKSNGHAKLRAPCIHPSSRIFRAVLKRVKTRTTRQVTLPPYGYSTLISRTR